MTQAAGLAGQFILRGASAIAPQVISAATNVAASSIYTAGQNLLFGPERRDAQGPRRDELRIQGAAEGGGIPRLFGRQRLAGQIIWTGTFREETDVTRTRTGGKGVSRAREVERTDYIYTGSFAIGLCEGEIARIGRVWADGELISLRDYSYRLHLGSEEQEVDPLIAAEEAGDVPAFRGLAYIVFEDLPLTPFGNRIPQFNFEVERPLSAAAGSLEAETRSVVIIPGSGEAVYSTSPVLNELQEGVSQVENRWSTEGDTDFGASLDKLQAHLPNTEMASLVVSWFGTDLRAGQCRVEPRVEDKGRFLLPDEWSVAGVDRDGATEVSRIDAVPAYGGTPSDQSVREALTELTARGLAVTFCPFILMDIPADGGLPDPSGQGVQAEYPWRGRIRALAANDGTAAARAEVDHFFDHYAVMVRHYAELCAEMGGVEAFLLGSELRGLTHVRDETGAFPAVTRLIALAAEVRGILGPGVKISYGADWTEYGTYHPDDGSGDVLFPLDPLWADDNIDFIGIDNYMPLADWRDETGHLDKAAGAAGLADAIYLEGNVAGGEGFDWYYASLADREAQTRTPIIDTAHGEHWVFRTKDFVSWWSEQHVERPGGMRGLTPTDWVPQSKPIWFTELGCPAVDKGANQPNVFYDPKSSESTLPYFSDGTRDDVGQRAFLEAHFAHWSDEENNPNSEIYGGSMVDPSRLFLYCWDARPFPDFPLRGDVWADGDNWTFGHWLNGRAGKVPVASLLREMFVCAGVPAMDLEEASGLVTGYLLDAPAPVRSSIEPLLDAFRLDAVERGGVLRVAARAEVPVVELHTDRLIDAGEAPLSLERQSAGERASGVSLRYTDGFADYRPGVAAVRYGGAVGTTALVDTALVLDSGEAEAKAATLLAEARAMSTTAQFSVPSGALDLEPGDVVTITEADQTFTGRVLTITDGPWREVEAVSTSPLNVSGPVGGVSGDLDTPPVFAGPPRLAFLDLPLLEPGQQEACLKVAAYASPWPGRVSLFDGEAQTATTLGAVKAPSAIGRLTVPLSAGPLGRWDRHNAIEAAFSEAGFESVTEAAARAGEARLAIKAANGEWEVISYQKAALTEAGTWQFTTLLRGQRGTEVECQAGALAGAEVVALSSAQECLAIDESAIGVGREVSIVPRGALLGSFPSRVEQITPQAISLRPFAPVGLQATVAGDSLTVTWIRRTRIGGDNWTLPEVPLGEAGEAYLVTAYSASDSVLHREMVSEPRAVLAASGVARVTVAQVSATTGPGRMAELRL